VASDPAATTNAAGNYVLTGVTIGDYTLRLELPADSVTDSPGGAYTIDVLAGADFTGLDFGVRE
jgi:hypothetical protein